MSQEIPRRKLGRDGPELPSMGYGMMGLSSAYGPIPADDQRMALLDHIYESGIRFWDSANVYQDSEDLLGRWFAKNPEKRKEIFLATKFGIVYDWKTQALSTNNTPEYIREAIESSLKRIGTDYIDLYYIHRIQNDQPIEVAMRELKTLKDEGKIRHIGVCEAGEDTLRRACKIVHVDAHQVEYSPFCLDIESPEINVLKTCRELGIATIAYSPLSRGFLTGTLKSPDDFAADDFRRVVPRFQGEAFYKNLELVDTIKSIASQKGCTAGQLTLAFLMKNGQDVFPIPGTTKIANFDENVGALKIDLTDDEMEPIRKAIADTGVKGARYPPGMTEELFATTKSLE